MVKRLKNTFLIIIICICSLLFCGCEVMEEVFDYELDPSTFDGYTNELLITLVGGDELTCNYYFADREKYGLDYYEPKLPTPSVTSVTGLAAINLIFGQVKNYDYDKLNEDQKMTYNILVNLIDGINAETTEMSYLDNNYLGSYLGYQAQLPLLLTEYNFRTKRDIENYLKYLKLIPETFETYYNFEVEKAEKGYGMPDFVIAKVKNQCTNFISGIDNQSTFMFNVVKNKINECDFLTQMEKVDYIALNKSYIEDYVKKGYQFIESNIDSLKGKAKNNEGLAGFYTAEGDDIGKQYYELMFKDAVGYDISCEDAITYVENKMTEYLDDYIAVNKQINANQSIASQLDLILDNKVFFMDKTPEEQLELYKTLILDDFPSLSVEPTIVVNYIDESMQENFSPAAYMTSPIDEITTESIYLNPADIYLFDDNKNKTDTLDYNYLYNTLAHEGLPGHLYQTAYFKSLDVNPIRKVLKNSGYVEGWATYTENYVYKYLKGKFDPLIIKYMIANTNFTSAFYSRLDLGIHYEGWSLEETYNFMKTYLNIGDMESIRPAYEQLVEIPTNYQKYMFTYLKFADMYEKVSEHLGDEFNAKDYHKTILDCGPAPLKYVEDVVFNKYGIK